MSRRAVFLDRDGVLSIPEFRDGRSFAPTRLEDFHLYSDAAPSVAQLKDAGFMVIVATNQPDVTTGRMAASALEAMHKALSVSCLVDAIEVSTATRVAPDRRRKPNPGMLLDAVAAWDIDVATSYMVGDRASDIACGRAAGVRTVFIDRGYTSETLPTDQDATVKSLGEAVAWILGGAKR
ncbi:MAG: HAD-IIIA family hydrolase [Pseudomonadota bacterium]